MILLTILAIILFLVGMLAIGALALGGTIGFILFGDLIACVVVIVWLMKLIRRKKK